ncbi:MAG: PDZ domain-containing protein [Vicinamibacteraceae bacterium]
MTAPPSRTRYVTILTFASTLILVGGWLMRPRVVPRHPAPIVPETELEQLARRRERRSLDAMAQYFAETAGEAAASLVFFPAGQRSGLVWGDRQIVSSPMAGAAAGTSLVAATPAGETSLGLTVLGPHLPIVALESTGPLAGLSPVRPAEAAPDAGAWVVAVWRVGAEPAFMAGTFLQSATATCGVTPVVEVVSSLALTAAMTGGGLFTADGDLLGMMVSCGERTAVIDVASIRRVLSAARSADGRLLQRYGLRLTALSAAEAQHFAEETGLLVREVWLGTAGSLAGLRPGDLLSVVVDGAAVAGEAALAALMAANADPVTLSVRRGSTRSTIALSAAPGGATGAASPASGVVFEQAAPGYGIAVVQPDSAADRAGVRAGDRLVSINQLQPRSVDQVRRLLDGAGPSAWLEIQRGERRLGVLLEARP